jgi:hypothetical protein
VRIRVPGSNRVNGNIGRFPKPSLSGLESHFSKYLLMGCVNAALTVRIRIDDNQIARYLEYCHARGWPNIN